MHYYAQINQEGICIGISSLASPIDSVDMILIEEYNIDKIWRKYENGSWSAIKFEPEVVLPPDSIETQLQELQASLITTQETVDFLLGIGV